MRHSRESGNLELLNFQTAFEYCRCPTVIDSRFRGNDGRAVSVAPDKCRNLKSRHSLKNRKPKSET
ncbi:hypothetical protein EZZ76_03100 [Neisseria meningitidis]|nr:hypothetical protein [Neisseria meningitidis]